MLAHYTRRIMVDFFKLGWSAIEVDEPKARIDVARARSRLQNAASRLGVKITTNQFGKGLIAKVIDYKSSYDRMKKVINGLGVYQPPRDQE